MEILKKVLKEIGIAILLGLLVAAVAAVLFVDKIPFSKQIPESINYTKIDENDYNVRGDVEDLANATETYVSKASQLSYYEFIKYILPGRYRPFGSVRSGTDIPSEYVGVISTPVATPAEESAELEGDDGTEGADKETHTSEPADLIEQGLQEQSYGEIDLNGLKQDNNADSEND